jgi:hypothetical protein
MANSRRRTSSAPTTRRIGRREPKRLIVVVCEGERTEPTYLKAVERHSPSSVLRFDIVDDAGSAPKKLVEEACRVRRTAIQAQKRTGDPNEAVDQVWCVFDVDDHHLITEACEQARANGVLLAISNPAIELWFLLHFQDQSAFLDRHRALRLLKTHLPEYDKRLENLAPLLDRFADASARARMLAARHKANATEFPHNNPSSDVHLLIEALGATY